MPNGMSMTRAPCVTAYRIPAAAVATDRRPEPPAMTGRIAARGAMPTGPAPVPRPAIIAARPRRSGRLAWAPLSTSATVTPAPWDSGHTFRCTRQAASHHSPGPGASRARDPLAREDAAASGSAHSTSRPTARADSRRNTPLGTDGQIAPAHRPRPGKEPVTIRPAVPSWSAGRRGDAS